MNIKIRRKEDIKMLKRSEGLFGPKGRGVFALVLLLVVVLSAGSVTAANPLKSTSKLSPRLETLSQNQTRSPDSQVLPQLMGLAASGPMSLIKNATDQPLVSIRVTETGQDQISALTRNGACITHVSDRHNVVTAYVSTAQLDNIAGLSFVKHVSEVLKPMVNQADCSGAITSEGDTQLRADIARSKYSVDGTGVTVGILSDSYNQVTAPSSADDDILSGDLPGIDNPCGRTTPVSVLVPYTGTDGADEGRAMAQIVHDLAPGATLAFASAFNGLFEFADNIVALRQAGADIIVDDVTYYDEPVFQDGPISVAIAEVVADGAQYFTSAGNSNAVDGSGNNISSYEAVAYRCDSCPTITYAGSAYDAGADCHDFDPGSGATTYQEVVLGDGGGFICLLQWAEPWFAVVTDLDLYVIDSTGEILAYSVEANISSTGGSDEPYEAVNYQNTTGADQTVRIVIARYSGADTPRCKYIFIRSADVISTGFNATNTTTDAFGPSIVGHSGEDTALSIAAVPYDDATSPEDYTSQGYFTVYYGPVTSTTPASALATSETRQKPDVAATDGGATTFFYQLIGSTYRFYGTSAAAPHAAAVAALVSENYYNAYGLMPTQSIMETSLETTAATIASGSQIISGAGLINAVAATNEALNHEIQKISSTHSSGGCFISVLDKK